jgi:hypothetical protein
MLGALADIVRRPVAPTADSGRAPGEGDSFPQQWAYVTSDARFNAVCCSRRAGKTVGDRLRKRLLMATRPGIRCHYATLIRRNCKKLFWEPIKDELSDDGWDFRWNDTDMILSLPNGSWLQALSCDDMRDIRTIRGDLSGDFSVDECQEPQDDVLEALAIKVAMPMLMDTGGSLNLLGTVPEVEPCFFSDALDSPKWRSFGWDCFANPHMDPEEIKRTCDEAGIGPGHPIYEREILGRRVKDPSKLAYEYDPGRNDYDPGKVDFATGPWRHSLGLDLGFQDRDAIVVLAWRRDDFQKKVYVRHWWQQNHMDVDALHEVVRDVLGTYRTNVIVGDHGGHGATKVLKTLEARLGVVIQVKPGDVMVSVGFVNDDLRTGRLLIPASSELASDLGRVQRTVNQHTKRVEINKKGYHSDLSEALRYAHHGARHWAAKAPKPAETRDERRARQDMEYERRLADPWR